MDDYCSEITNMLANLRVVENNFSADAEDTPAVNARHPNNMGQPY